MIYGLSKELGDRQPQSLGETFSAGTQFVAAWNQSSSGDPRTASGLPERIASAAMSWCPKSRCHVHSRRPGGLFAMHVSLLGVLQGLPGVLLPVW